MASDLNSGMSQKTSFLGLKVWELVAIFVGASIVVILLLLVICLTLRKRSRRARDNFPLCQIPEVSKEIKEIRIDDASPNKFLTQDGTSLAFNEKFSDRETEKVLVLSENGDNSSRSGSFNKKNVAGPHSSEEKMNAAYSSCRSSSHPISMPSPLSGLPEFSHLGWGHWFTLRDLEQATNQFSKENVMGGGGYGVVYKGRLINGAPVAVKKLLNDIGQAEKEFRVEVEAIGHVRHKNLVRLLGYCIEGIHRTAAMIPKHANGLEKEVYAECMLQSNKKGHFFLLDRILFRYRLLVYEYVNNGNLEQWLHGAMHQRGYLNWEARMKVILGTAKALAYLHEAIEPKVVHRDIKSSNILIDDKFNAKISDFGLAKLLCAGKSHVTTRVMGTFGYVAPEYANSGLLNEKSDVYSFGVVLLETITGRDPVDHSRPSPEVNLVDWLKMMVGSRRAEEVVDPNIETRPSTSALKRALLNALRCIDPDPEKRPRMSQVVRLLESEDYPLPREDNRRRRKQNWNAETENKKETSFAKTSEIQDLRSESRRDSLL